MNMPGFTGEASLYKTGRHYYKAGNLTQTDGAYPALIRFDQLHDFPFARYFTELFTELCCSRCRRDCRRECSGPFGGRPDQRCVDYCVNFVCPRYCGGCS
jgi:hypothetical protein